LDLDNTLIDYSPAFGPLVIEHGLGTGTESRDQLRDRLRRPDSDEQWQLLQSVLYTDGLAYATMAPGALDCIETALALEWCVCIVSHKTFHTPERFGSRDLRTPAKEWLARVGVVDLVGSEHVHFAESQDEKVALIAEYECDVFVDDLEAVLANQSMPAHTLRVLYRPGRGWKPTEDGLIEADFPALSKWLVDAERR
jgi:hypothetical protein